MINDLKWPRQKICFDKEFATYDLKWQRQKDTLIKMWQVKFQKIKKPKGHRENLTKDISVNTEYTDKMQILCEIDQWSERIHNKKQAMC